MRFCLIAAFALFFPASISIALDAPVLRISTLEFSADTTRILLEWNSVQNADSFHVFGRILPGETDSLYTTITDTSLSLALPSNDGSPGTHIGFFHVIPDSIPQQSDLILVPAGPFEMGEAGVASPVHQVTLTRDFYLGKFEVTNQEFMEALQWALENPELTGVSASESTVQAYGEELLDLDGVGCQIVYENGLLSLLPVIQGDYQGQSSAMHPVMQVSWYGAACYCDWRSLMSGLPAFYEGNWVQDASHDPYTALGYRLPTEAEWEYAAQFNDERTWPWGDSPYPNCAYANAAAAALPCDFFTAPVGSYPLGNTELGLADMAGNVIEWVGDRFSSYDDSSRVDPPGPSAGAQVVARGGAWNFAEGYLRCAYRVNQDPWSASSSYGFRVCRTDLDASELPPVASLEIDLVEGTTSSIFRVDASGSMDAVTPAAQLEVRWDWQNDGFYDTDWSTTKRTTVQFASEGQYTLKMEVRDADGLTAEDEVQVEVAPTEWTPEMVTVPAGTFTMGSNEGLGDEEGPAHPVTLTRSFHLGAFEVTWDGYLNALQWAYEHFPQTNVSVSGDLVLAYGEVLFDMAHPDCMLSFDGNEFSVLPIPSGTYQGQSSLNHPALYLSFYAAACFCDWINLLQGHPPFYEGVWSQNDSHNPYEATGFRVPTEAEWEYAAQFDSGRRYPWGDFEPNCDVANMRFEDYYCVEHTAPVGSTPLGNNALGLSDMGGNVWEWTGDYWGSYSADLQVDPMGPDSSEYVIYGKGGSYFANALFMRCANRAWGTRGGTGDTGLRLCRTAAEHLINTPPTANFTVTPEEAVLGEEIQFDATSSSDPEGPGYLLAVRWDWEDDGVYDTNWTRTRTATHAFPSDGEFTIRLQVKDLHGALSETSQQVIVNYPESAGEFINVPAGAFEMGEEGYAGPLHTVVLANDFLLGRNEVTNQQYLEALQWAWSQDLVEATSNSVTAYGVELLDLNGFGCDIAFQDSVFILEPLSGGYPSGMHPVSRVTWYGAACYCDWRSMMAGLPPFYEGDWSQTVSHNPYTATGYRLPTEAEWEFAAQYNDERAYPWGAASPTCTLANSSVSGGCFSDTTPVGSFPQGMTTLGHLDMAGNCREWVGDYFQSYLPGTQFNPLGAASGTQKVIRGGYYDTGIDYQLRCSFRLGVPPAGTNSGTGFRLCRSAGAYLQNTAPVPGFQIEPPIGQPATIFLLDAGETSDAESPLQDLEFRWDWEDDGQFDTAWSPAVSAQHMYGVTGLHTIRMQARDPQGLVSDETRSVLVGNADPAQEFALVPAGTFLMGDSLTMVEHSVTLTEDFLLGKREVSSEQFLLALQWAYDHAELTGVTVDTSFANCVVYAHGKLLTSPSPLPWERPISLVNGQFTMDPVYSGLYAGSSRLDHPVNFITWHGAACYCDWRSMIEGLPPYYEGNWDQTESHNPYFASGYRLPTEAEWERAVRYPDGREDPWGGAEPSCNLVNAAIDTVPCVDGTTPVYYQYDVAVYYSDLGLYNMVGNVAEWVGDAGDYYDGGSQTNPLGPVPEPEDDWDLRVLRGGHYTANVSNYHLGTLRSWSLIQGNFGSKHGFRLCKRAN